MKAWLLASGFLFVSLWLLGPALLVAAFPLGELSYTMGMLAYRSAQSIFPLICPLAIGTGHCFDDGLARYWSLFVWIPVIVGFGFGVRRVSWPWRLLAGVGTIVLTMLLLQGVIAAFGWRQYIDSV